MQYFQKQYSLISILSSILQLKKKIIHFRKRIIVHEFGETNVYRLDERARSVPRNRITDVSVTAGARNRTSEVSVTAGARGRTPTRA